MLRDYMLGDFSTGQSGRVRDVGYTYGLGTPGVTRHVCRYPDLSQIR